MSKKMIRLINNERINTKIASQKACSTGADDHCVYEDNAHCTTYAYDYCHKDYAACRNGADDVCYANYDYTVCVGPGTEDSESSDE